MFDENLILEQNEHWSTGKANPSYIKEYKRIMYKKLLNGLANNRIIILKGLRRTGKSTLMFQLIKHLLENNISNKHIFYFSFDQTKAELKELLEFYADQVLQEDIKKNRIFLFLDEIQKLEDWQNKVKAYYDTYPNIKFILTGSANIALAKAKESLAGRITFCNIGTLSFKEYLEFNKLPTEKIAKNKIKPLLNKYMKQGLFFETMGMDDKELNDYLEHTIIDRILYVDLPVEYEIGDRELLKRIYSILLDNPGMLVDYQSLSRKLGRDRRTIEKYISYLEYSMLLKRVYNYSTNRLTSEKKLKKAYPTIIKPILNQEGKIAENIVLINSNARFFYRDAQKREVDFILTEPVVPIEVKYRNDVQKKELRGLLIFMKKYNLKSGIVITKDIEKKSKFEDKEIVFIPLWVWLLKSE